MRIVMLTAVVFMSFYLRNGAFAAPTLDCAAVETYEDETDGEKEYFKVVRKNRPSSGEYRSQLLRKSVAAFNYQIDATGMSDEELNDVGEDVALSEVKDINGVTYHAVNVGFGGGNSATYYYYAGTLELAPVFMYDGDCVDQGTQPEFPFEKTVENPLETTLSCAFENPKAPFRHVQLDVKTSRDGEFYSPVGNIVVAGENPIVEGLTLTTNDRASLTNVPVGAGSKAPYSLTTYINLEGQKDDTKWKGNLTYTFRQNRVQVSGRLYPNIAGGYWDEQAVELKNVRGTCAPALDIKKVVYYRVVNYTRAGH